MINFLTPINYLSCVHQDMITNKILSCSGNDWKLFIDVAIFFFMANFIIASADDASFEEAFGTSIIISVVGTLLFTLFMLVFGSFLLYGIFGFISLYGIHALFADERNNSLKRATKNWQKKKKKK